MNLRVQWGAGLPSSCLQKYSIGMSWFWHSFQYLLQARGASWLSPVGGCPFSWPYEINSCLCSLFWRSLTHWVSWKCAEEMRHLVKVSHHPDLQIYANPRGRNALLSDKTALKSSQAKTKWWGREWKEWIYLNKIDNTAANVYRRHGSRNGRKEHAYSI